jgi:xanthine dehydrogenase accessory factor
MSGVNSGPVPFRRVAELDEAGAPFATAMVVAVQRPTSARPGARGIVHPDGSIEGWVGGSCAQPVVVREALRSLQDGQPRLLRLSKDAPAEGRRGDGVVELVMTCHSGGTLEIYVEPHLPAPVLWVAGDRRHVRHLAEHDGVVYAFCSMGCRTRFIKEPEAFLAAPGTHSMEAS